LFYFRWKELYNNLIKENQLSILTLVTVPIGNIEDITKRGSKKIIESDCILAEDSRVLRKLLGHLGINSSKNIISYHEHSDDRKLQQIMDILDSGENITLVSDAGSPIISDPAYPLIKAILKSDHQLMTCPGVSSLITALELSGLPANPFCFNGFFPRESDKQKILIELFKNRIKTKPPNKASGTVNMIING
jgi:16S rRNA (cytidine1402-2'-O)-methyltransferase